MSLATLNDRSITSEHVILSTFVVISSYMFVAAYQFPGASQTFPQFTAGLTFIGSMLLLLRNYLPESIKAFVATPVNIADAAGNVEGEIETQEGAEPHQTETEDIGQTRTADRPINDSLFTALLTAAYIFGGYLFGMVWVTPVFIIMYTYRFKQSWYVMVGLATVGTAIAITFVLVLGLALDTGVVTEALGLA